MSENAEKGLPHLKERALFTGHSQKCPLHIAEGGTKVGQMKEIYEMKGAGRSIRGIAGELGIAGNTVRRYLESPRAMKPRPQPRRASKLDPYLIRNTPTAGWRRG